MITQLLTHSGWYILAVTVQRGLPLLLLPLVATELGSEALGLVALGALVAGAITLVSTFGLNISSVRFGASTDRQASPEARSGMFATQFGWSIAVGLIAVGMTWVWWPWPMSDGGRSVAFAAVLLGIFQSWLQMAMSTFRAREQPVHYFAVAAGVLVVSVPSVLVLVPIHGAFGYLLGLAVGVVVPAAVALISTLSKPKFDRVFLRAAFVLAAPFFVHWISTWVLVGFDRFQVESALGLEATGVYYLAFVYGAVPLLIVDAFGTAWVPRFLASEADEASRGRLSVLISLGIVSLVLIGLGAALVVLPILYADLDTAILPLLAILAPLAVIRVPHIVGSAPLIQQDRTTVLGSSSLTAAVVNVALVYAVVSSGGLFAVAWAKVLAYALATIWVSFAVNSQTQRVQGFGIVMAGVALSAGAFGIMDTAVRLNAEVVAIVVFGALGVLAIGATKRYFGIHFQRGVVDSFGTES